MTIREACDLYVSNRILKSKGDPNTAYWYDNLFNIYVIPFFKEKTKLKSITEEKAREFIEYLTKIEKKDNSGKYSNRTIESAFGAFSTLIRYFYKNNPSKNCVKEIKLSEYLTPARHEATKKEKKLPSEQELEKFEKIVYEYANIRIQALYSLFNNLGSRFEEYCGFKWKTIDEMTGDVDYGDAITDFISKKFSEKYTGDSEKLSGIRIKGLKSPASYRNNELSIQTLKVMMKYKAFKQALGLSTNANDFIFTVWDSNKPITPSALRREFNKFKEKYNFNFDIIPYYFRHEVTNDLLDCGYSLQHVARYMGNSAFVIAKSYTEINEKRKSQIAKDIEKKRILKKQKFCIETIVKVLSDTTENKKSVDVYELLDFITGKQTNNNNFNTNLEISKQIILFEYPKLKIFCDTDKKRIEAKIETYKNFQEKDEIEITQDFKTIDKIKYKTKNI